MIGSNWPVITISTNDEYGCHTNRRQGCGEGLLSGHVRPEVLDVPVGEYGAISDAGRCRTTVPWPAA